MISEIAIFATILFISNVEFVCVRPFCIFLLRVCGRHHSSRFILSNVTHKNLLIITTLTVAFE